MDQSGDAKKKKKKTRRRRRRRRSDNETRRIGDVMMYRGGVGQGDDEVHQYNRESQGLGNEVVLHDTQHGDFHREQHV